MVRSNRYMVLGEIPSFSSAGGAVFSRMKAGSVAVAVFANNTASRCSWSCSKDGEYSYTTGLFALHGAMPQGVQRASSASSSTGLLFFCPCLGLTGCTLLASSLFSNCDQLMKTSRNWSSSCRSGSARRGATHADKHAAVPPGLSWGAATLPAYRLTFSSQRQGELAGEQHHSRADAPSHWVVSAILSTIGAREESHLGFHE